MLTIEQLKQAVHQPGVTKTDAALLCVAAGGGNNVPTASVRKLAMEAGVRGGKKANFSSLLAAAGEKAFKTPKGWELTASGRKHVAALVGKTRGASQAVQQAVDLRALLPKLKSEDARQFLLEAVLCTEQTLYRAAVVLSWVGAMSLMHEAAVAKHLATLNAEALRRDSKWKAAKSASDLGRLKEYDFLQIAEAVGLIDKNVKQELEACLRLRNSCGHPNSLKIGSSKVAAHLETLALNVYSVFA